MKKWLILFLLISAGRPAHAIEITVGPTLTGSPITSETGLSNGVTVQFTLDSAGQAQVDFFQVSPVDSSLTQVASLTKTGIAGGASTPVFWNALWLIGTDFARRSGTFFYQVTPSTGGTTGTALPTVSDPAGLFTINSVDIHNLTVTPSLDAAQQPTFPYTIGYALAKPSLVTAKIINSSGTLVRTLLSGQLQADETVSSATVTWNGLDNSGTSVPIGIYVSSITASDPNSGEQAIPRSKSFAVTSLAGAASDPQKLFEDNVFVYPNPVRNGQGTFHMEAVRDGANLSLKIYTITGTLVREQSFPGIAAGNVNEFTWDVTNQSGNKVGRGLYYYVVREEDEVGTLQAVKKLAVIP